MNLSNIIFSLGEGLCSYGKSPFLKKIRAFEFLTEMDLFLLLISI